MKIILTVLTTLLLAACDQKVQAPEFAVAVLLTKEAEARLHALNESIMVAAYLDGDGMSRPGEHTAPFRNVFLEGFTEAVDNMNVAHFKGKRVSAKKWAGYSTKTIM